METNDRYLTGISRITILTTINMRKIIIALALVLASVSAVTIPTHGKFKNLAQNTEKKLAEAESRENHLASKLSFAQIEDITKIDHDDMKVDEFLMGEEEL